MNLNKKLKVNTLLQNVVMTCISDKKEIHRLLRTFQSLNIVDNVEKMYTHEDTGHYIDILYVSLYGDPSVVYRVLPYPSFCW